MSNIEQNKIKLAKGIGRREFLKKTSLGAGCAAIGLATQGFSSSPLYAKGNKHLIAAIGAEPPSLDPHALEQRIPQTITWNIYEGLVDRNHQGMIVPGLAESWMRIDSKTVRFKLRSGVKFHNGEPFNADAAVFSINRIIDPNTKSQWIGVVNTIIGAKKVDNLTVDVFTKAPDPIFLSRLWAIVMMAPNWTKEVGKQVGSQTNGTGAYKLVDWKRNLQVELAANDQYWGGVPDVKEVTVRIIGEDSTRFQAVKTGELDIYLGPMPDHLPELPTFQAGLAQSFSFVRLSTMKGSKVLDPRVRQAMNYAVNKEAILEKLHHGQGKILPGQISSPEMFGYNDHLQAYPYDLDKAKSLVNAAGAKGLEIDYVASNKRYAGDAIEAQAIAGMLEQAGLKINLKLSDPQSWVRFGDRNQTPVPPSCWYVRHDNMLFDADRTMGSYYTDESPYSAYHNDKIRGLFERARTEMNVQRREFMYEEAFKIGSQQDPVALFLFQHADLWALTKRTKFSPLPDGRLLIKTITLDN